KVLNCWFLKRANKREWIIEMHGVGLGLAVAEEAMKGFQSIISIDNCEGCVKRCLA
ncbi:unnamed protein product, partial [Sphenostylis stenocarpa]